MNVTFSELLKIHQAATAFMVKHRTHVDKLVAAAEYSYEPSGSDRFHPELWKEAHWKWYKENRDDIKVIVFAQQHAATSESFVVALQKGLGKTKR